MPDIISMSVEQAELLLKGMGINNYFIEHYIDRKQTNYDNCIVTRVKLVGENYQLLVCPMQFEVKA